MDIQKPSTITTPDGNELTKQSPAQGSLINDGVNDRVLIGFQKDGFGDGKDLGIKVSQTGFDVKTASDDQLVMSSGFNSLKIVATGTATLGNLSITYSNNARFTNSQVSVSHNLGYIPIVIAYVDSGSGRASLPYSTISMFSIPASVGSINHTQVDFLVTSTDILFNHVLYVSSAASGTTSSLLNGASVKYYLFRETAN